MGVASDEDFATSVMDMSSSSCIFLSRHGSCAGSIQKFAIFYRILSWMQILHSDPHVGFAWPDTAIMPVKILI